MKNCKKCGKSSDEVSFWARQSNCIECAKENNREYRKKNKEKINTLNRLYRKANPEKVYNWNKKSNTKLRQKDPEKWREYFREWAIRNHDKVLESSRKNDAKRKNCPKRREYNRNYLNSRRKSEPTFRILENLRRRLNYAMKHNSKKDSTLSLIGCSVEELRKHLESQFKNGMNWENYGNKNRDHSDCWHVDHITPCSSFDLSTEEGQRKCFHYSNLQPMWGLDNIRKSNKV